MVAAAQAAALDVRVQPADNWLDQPPLVRVLAWPSGREMAAERRFALSLTDLDTSEQYLVQVQTAGASLFSPLLQIQDPQTPLRWEFRIPPLVERQPEDLQIRAHLSPLNPGDELLLSIRIAARDLDAPHLVRLQSPLELPIPLDARLSAPFDGIWQPGKLRIRSLPPGGLTLAIQIPAQMLVGIPDMPGRKQPQVLAGPIALLGCTDDDCWYFVRPGNLWISILAGSLIPAAAGLWFGLRSRRVRYWWHRVRRRYHLFTQEPD